jgi:hypothetical protein
VEERGGLDWGREPGEGQFQAMETENGPEFFDPGEYQAPMPWEFGEPALEVGRLGEAVAELQEMGANNAVEGDGGRLEGGFRIPT